MAGPSPATTALAPSAVIVSTAVPITPATRPRQPTWTAPWMPSGDPRATGPQSAVSTTTHAPVPTATTASASGTPPSPATTQALVPGGAGASTTTTSDPWTWRIRCTDSPCGTAPGSDAVVTARWSPPA